MTLDWRRRLVEEVQTGGYAYARNLAAAEAAVLRGQFNVAKVLRAAAHTQRILAMRAARRLAVDFEATALLETILGELQDSDGAEVFFPETELDGRAAARLEHAAVVREGMRDVIRRALSSLGENPDVLESDVHQSLWGCFRCGNVVEAGRPDACPVCGALGVEFQWFGPFYARTPEHLGQLTPAEITATLAAIPDQVAEAIAAASDDVLRRKPSEAEWCVKEIIGHVIETDRLFAQRASVVLEGQGMPVIPRSAPPWKLHEGKGYETLPAGELLERLRAARSASLELVRGLSDEHWMRQGILMDTATSLLDLGTWLANHDRGHLAQIRNLCAG